MLDEKRRIVVFLPAKKDVERLAPLEDMTRDELILAAINRFLKPHLDTRKQVLKAAANPGKLHGPFDTADEMIADMKSQLKRRAALRKRGSA